MLNILFQLDFFVQRVHVAVHVDAGKTLLFELVEKFLKFALSSAHHRRKNLQLCALFVGFDFVANLVHRNFGDWHSAIGAIRNAYARKKQTQVVVNFRHRAYRGTRIGRSGFLVDGYCRGQTFDAFHVRFFHKSQKLTSVRRQTFHVAALTFGKNRVECKRRLARTGQSRKHNQFVTRNGYRKAF